ncbi:MAG TPA: type II CAAX endopeptidase family protein [Bacteroidales bacterium]|nr:type II CAAX endopeptidase family protein [Bacteroidales bacterium]
MRNSERLIWGILLTTIVFLISTFVGARLNLNIAFFNASFGTDMLMLILSIGLIYGLKKYVRYRIALPRFRKMLKPMLFGFLAAVIINSLLSGIGNIFKIESESHFVFKVMSPLQIFLYIFILASIAEEVLFRGFLQNILKPLQDKGIKIFKRHISLPVIIAALAFSLGHLILINSGAGAYFVFTTLVFTFVLGLIAGYYQEKHNNNAYAIIVHMSGNFMGVIASLIVSFGNLSF